jgi:hypothetical protein
VRIFFRITWAANSPKTPLMQEILKIKNKKNKEKLQLQVHSCTVKLRAQPLGIILPSIYCYTQRHRVQSTHTKMNSQLQF